MKSNEFRIFLSSTFRDLMPEREQLVKKVFPQIRALCRERGVEFTEIDLRWGITEEEARTGKTVRICLEEIDRCPYFLGIIGSRYGWAPGISLIETDSGLTNEYPWIGHYAKEGKSITDIEFSHGAILPRKRLSTNIYEQIVERDTANSEAITDLRSRITSAGLPHHTFSSPQELGEKVLRDLTAILDRDWPHESEPTPLELERAPHIAFSVNRRRSYVANPEYLKRFEEHIASDGPPLILWARSGLGKSALVAYLSHEHLKRYPDAFVITHFIGAAAAGSDPEDVMLQIMMEIKERYSLDDEIPLDDQAIRDSFPAWLAKVQNEKLLLVIDALNQLSGIAKELHWLPEYIPPNVRLVVSTTPGHVLDRLRKHPWQELELQPLAVPIRRKIAEEYLERYHKTLAPGQLDQIAADPKCESPLFLRTLLEELRVFGRHESFKLHLAHYLGCSDERDLFAMILERMENDHGSGVVRSVMQAIFGSRYGLSDTELLGVTSLSRLDLSEFLIALEYHLMQRSGLYTFFHNYLREAVEFRYAHDNDEKKEIHHHIASYFSVEAYNTRRRDEEPWQWQHAENPEAFKTCITDIPMLEMLLDETRLQELIGYWVELQKNYDLAQTYHGAIEEYRLKCDDEPYFAELSGKLGNALVSASHYKEAEYHLRNALEMRKKLLGEDDLKTAQSMNDLSILYYHTGNFTEAEALLRSVIEIREKILDKNDPAIAKAWNDRGAILYSQGKLDEAEDCYQNALKRYQSFFKNDHTDIAGTLCNLGTISYFRKKHNDAIEFFNKSIAMYERMYGVSNFSIIPPMGNLAMAYMEIRDYEKAEPLLLRVLSLTKSIYGNFHESIRSTYVNLGVFYSRIKEYRKAIDLHKEALEISKRILGDEHYLTINSHLSVGMNVYRSGEFEEGKKLIEKYLPLQKEKLGANHQMFKVQEDAWNELLKG